MAALSMVGSVILGMGATLLALRTLAGRRSSGGMQGAGQDRIEEQRAQARAREELERALNGLALADRHGVDPPHDLPTQLERIQDLIRDHQDHESRLAESQGRISEITESLERLRSVLPIELPASPSEAAPILELASREADDRQRRVETARAQLGPLEREDARLGDRLRRVTEERNSFADRLRLVGDGVLETGIVRARARLEALSSARKLEDELKRNHADLDVLRGRIDELEDEADGWALDSATLATATRREPRSTNARVSTPSSATN